MSFFVLPPEINSLRMFIGAGTAPMLQAAAAWEGLAEELGSAAQSFLSVTTGLAGQAWQGAASAAMTAAAAPYAAWLTAAATQSAGAGGQARALASMFEAARAATVLPTAVDANRNAFVQLVMSNLFGQNAGLIAAAESIYEEMWAADVAAMSGYHSGASSVAAQMVPWANVLQRLPSLGAGMGGNSGGGAAGSPSAGNGGTENVGSGGANNVGDAGNVASGGGPTNLGTGIVGNMGGGNAAAGLLQPAPNYAGVDQGNPVIGGGSTGTAGMGAANPGSGSFGFVPIPIPNTAAGTTGTNQIVAGGPKPGTGDSVPSTQAPETQAPAAPEEVETPAPELGVLPTAPPEIAAKAAPVSETPATKRAGSGIPGSQLRGSAAGTKSMRPAETEDQQSSETAAEAAETPPRLQPESATGKLRPEEKETPRVRMRGA